MPKTKPRNEALLAVAQQMVAALQPGAFIPITSGKVDEVYRKLLADLIKRGFDPNNFVPLSEATRPGDFIVSFTPEGQGAFRICSKKVEAQEQV